MGRLDQSGQEAELSERLLMAWLGTLEGCTGNKVKFFFVSTGVGLCHTQSG